MVGGGGGEPSELYPNRPEGWDEETELDFSQTPVSDSPDNVDRAIPGSDDWSMIGFLRGATPAWTSESDATAPQSPPGTWVGHIPPGTYGSPESGHGIGNIFTSVMSGTSRVYISIRTMFDFSTNGWHSISNKMVNIECNNNALILMQSRETPHWRHASELSGSGNIFVDDGEDQGTDIHIPGQVSNIAIPNQQWVHLEIVIDLANSVYKIWQDGVLTTDAEPDFVATSIFTVGILVFRGGGGETLGEDVYYRHDHFFCAW